MEDLKGKIIKYFKTNTIASLAILFFSCLFLFSTKLEGQEVLGWTLLALLGHTILFGDDCFNKFYSNHLLFSNEKDECHLFNYFLYFTFYWYYSIFSLEV
jgi:hypothetical protein